MAEKVADEKYHHLEPANGHTHHDEEQSGTYQSEELKRQKRIKMYKYIGAFIVFQVVVMSVFAITVMKVRSPKIRLNNISVQTLTYSAATPSFEINFQTQIRVRNLNWGAFKFDEGAATFLYQGLPVGQVIIPKNKAGMRSTKKINVIVNVNSQQLPAGNSNLGTELGNGLLVLRSQAQLNGKVELMMIMKKRKTAQMDCSMMFNLNTRTIQNLECL